jgi:lipoyl synthase
LGNTCTRNCKFCATPTGKPPLPDINEPTKVAQSVRILSLKHVVLTSVDRDDLPDGGAQHWVRVVEKIRELNPDTTIEALLPDFLEKNGALEAVLAVKPEIVAHNIETVERITPSVRSRAQYRYSLGVLSRIASSGTICKSGMMLGLGETQEEIYATMYDLFNVGCQVLTLGQYLQPTKKHIPVQEYIRPEVFDLLAEKARTIGFRYVEAGPLVRSSFHAEKALTACGLHRNKRE